MRARLLAAVGLLVLLPSCMLFDVKEQQEKIGGLCTIGGRVDVERREAAPLVVVLVRQIGADPARVESWQLADHFVLEEPGLWQFGASVGTHGVVAFQDLSRDLKLQPDEPYLRLDPDRLVTCKPGERHTGLALLIPAAWDGHKAAEVGVKTVPVVVRVWVDMSPGSDYLRALYARDPGVEHHPLFTFRQTGISMGEASDGTVTVASQLRPAAQHGAARVEGFDETHTSVLESKAVSERLNGLLARLPAP